jgi:hypothetical protein
MGKVNAKPVQLSLWQQIKKAYKDMVADLTGDKKPDTEYQKAVKETMRARYHNNPNFLPGGPQSNANLPQDCVAFSPEALA